MMQTQTSLMPRDALGVLHPPVAPGAPLRIVSLVPSLTELLCELGLQPYLVGRTGFCIHPRELVRSIEKVGGTKDVRSERIRALAPTHLIVNIDENEKPTVDALAQSLPHMAVVVTHPQGPSDNLALYRLLGALFGAIPGVVQRVEELCARFASAMALIDALPPAPVRQVLYCIWQDPWMTVTRQTYIGQMLALIGWRQWEREQKPGPASAPDSKQNCVRESAESAVRYPVFTWSQDMVDQLDLILLSTEPYAFRAKHVDLLVQQTGKPVLLVDGEMLSWYGSRAIAGLEYLCRLRAISGFGSGD